jgi:hypothetical protein
MMHKKAKSNTRISVLYISIAMIIVGCNKRVDNILPEIYSQKLNVKYSFQLVDKVVLNYTDSFFIGRLRSLAVFHDGRLSLGDGLDGTVKITSSQGKFLEKISRKGSGPGETRGLENHCIDDSGRVWISDYTLHRVSVYDISGSVLDAWSPMVGCDDCYYIQGTIRVRNNTLYINMPKGVKRPFKVDDVSSVITAFDFKHTRVGEYGKFEQVLEDFFVPTPKIGFDIDSLGNLYFVHDHSHNIHKYSPDGKILKRFNYPFKEFRPIKERQPERVPLDKVKKWFYSNTVTGKLEIVGKYLFITFTNTEPEYINTPDRRYRHEYLQVFDLEGNCLVDYLKAPGQFLCSDHAGVLYFLEEEEPERMVISKYRFVVEREYALSEKSSGKK